jgi:hypothetical protein
MTYNFTKNMIIVLGIALIVTNIFTVGNGVKEGFKKRDKHGKKGEYDTIEEDEESNDNEHLLHSSSSTSEHNEKDKDDGDNGIEESPKLDNAPKTEPMHLMKKKNRIDYASTINDAYGDLSNILNSDGIKNLTNDTKSLMDQQLQLASAMKNMAPLMESAQSMLKGFDLKGLSSMLGGNN